ncbi:DUF2161 family putative PD-(D/E)XK-type phosphodiesterase, partial [Paenibacillus sp. 1-18]|uniref:DUF2161 family putative PD-(D/E)XK-type phosphodiesterase n=1 Tax=Paenibacillus sp. 1-18 TaxID=1333846 RepID=UPI0004711727
AAVSGAAAVLQHNYYGWFERVARGRYKLTPFGEAALSEYAAVLQEQGNEAAAAKTIKPDEGDALHQIAETPVPYSSAAAEDVEDD